MSHGPSNESNYDIHLLQREGVFFLHVPKLQILLEVSELTETYEKVQIQQRAMLNRFEDVGVTPRDSTEVLRDSALSPIRSRRTLFHEIASFVMKTFFVATVFMILSGELVRTVSDDVKTILGQYGQYRPQLPSFTMTGRILTDGVVNAADTVKQMTPERREEVVTSLRTIVQNIRPFANEFAPLFKAPSTSSSNTPDTKMPEK